MGLDSTQSVDDIGAVDCKGRVAMLGATAVSMF